MSKLQLPLHWKCLVCPLSKTRPFATCELAKWSILCEVSLFSQHRPPWITAYHSDMYSACFSCRVRTGLVSGMPFKTNAVHSWSLQMCRPWCQRFERIIIHHTDCRMNILKGCTSSQSRCPLRTKSPDPKRWLDWREFQSFLLISFPQHKACVGDLPSPSSRADRRKHDTD